MTQKKRSNRGPLRRHKIPEKIYGLEEANDRLRDIFFNHDFGQVPHDKRLQLAHFYQLLMQKQRSDNFTRLIQFRDIAIKHFIDCLMVPRLVGLEFPLLDVGTGPGFPGIPLKVHFPKDRIILAEGVKRRVDFLKEVRDEMKMENLDVVGRYIDQEFALPVRTVITRAVEDVSATLGHVSQCLEDGGQAIFMKGPNVIGEELDKAEAKWKDYYNLLKVIPYSLPKTSHHRHLVIFKKQKSVPYEPNH